MLKQKTLHYTEQSTLEYYEAELTKYKNILENMFEGYYEIDLDGSYIFFNKNIIDIMGYPKEEIVGLNYRQYATEAEAKKVYKIFNEVFKTGKPIKMQEYSIITKDGTQKIIQASINLKKDSQGNPIGFYGTLEDITTRKNLEKKLVLYANALNSMFDMVFILNPNGKIRLINNAAREFFKKESNDLESTNTDFWDLWQLDPKTTDKLKQVMSSVVTTKNTASENIKYEYQTFELCLTPYYENHQLHTITANTRDITSWVNYEEQLKEIAFVDDLTGAKTKRLLKHDLSGVLDRALRNNSTTAIFEIDADKLKKINDTYGHIFGDQYIIKVVEAISESVRKADRIYRYGGDEFFIICENSDSGARLILDKFRKNISGKKIEIGGQSLQVSASIGCYEFNIDHTSYNKIDNYIDFILKQADLAMYIDKKSKKKNAPTSDLK